MDPPVTPPSSPPPPPPTYSDDDDESSYGGDAQVPPPPDYPPVEAETAPLEYGDDDDDEENGNNNHSLPTLEQVRTEGVIHHGGSLSSRMNDAYNKYNVYSGQHKRRMALFVTFAVVVIAAIVGVSIAISGGNDNNTTSASVGSDISDTAFGHHDKTPQDPEKQKEPTEVDARFETIVTLLSAKISHSEDLELAGTPQNLAAQWMAANDDNALYDIPTNPHSYVASFQFVQRYILIVLYYALDGGNWSNDSFFLTPAVSECDWHFGLSSDVKPPGADTSSWSFGVQCNDKKEVSHIFISKYSVRCHKTL
jgi:hypothetical protein